MDLDKINKHIVAWLEAYCGKAGLSGFIVGISGGIDSAVTSTLCAQTGKKILLLNMPIRQTKAEYDRGNEHIENLKQRFPNVSSLEINLTATFEQFEAIVPKETLENHLAMANSRARLRMTTLYALAQTHNLLVAGTGNKVEDFGIGFFTKYGDGGVDLSPIADLSKTQVFALAKYLKVVSAIQEAKPTDGLWEDGRSDEDQIGATYPELEWAMNYRVEEDDELKPRQREVLALFFKLNRMNRHKMEPIPVCEIPKSFFL